MDPGYETVVDPLGVLWTLAAMLVHGGVIVLQLGLIGFLLATGVLALFRPDADTHWLRRLGVLRSDGSKPHILAAARVCLAVALAMPLVLGTPFGIAVAASLGALTLLIWLERGLPENRIQPGRLARRTAVASAAIVAAFSLWEGEDGLDLGVELLATAQHWRTHELDWQLTNDVDAPKVGDLAPDFELQDPSGESAVRLADFRGKRPVALVFGSYT